MSDAATSPSSRARSSTRCSRATAAAISTARSAPAATRRRCSTAPTAQVIAIDRDPDAIAAGQALAERYAPRLRLIEGRFGDMAELLSAEGVEDVDGVALDLGVSSMQFDQAGSRLLVPRLRSARHAHGTQRSLRRRSGERGRREPSSPTSSGATARSGSSRRVARAIVEARKHEAHRDHGRAGRDRAPCRRAAGQGRERSRHPHLPGAAHRRERRTGRARARACRRRAGAGAGRTAGRRLVPFAGGPRGQGIRARPRRPHARPVASRAAARRGRAATLRDLTRKPVLPSAAEIAANPRARSARLRVAEKLLA